MDPSPGSTLTPPDGGGASDFEKFGLPILLLFIVVLIFFSVHAAITWLPECEWWKKLTKNYTNVDDDKATFLQRRKGSLRRKLKGFKNTSIARGNDGRGGLSTGEISISDFDQVYTRSRTDLNNLETASTGSKAPSKSSIEDNEQPLNVAKFQNQAFENDPEDQEERPIMRDKIVNKTLERYRHSAEFYSQFSLVPLEQNEGNNASVESINATVHSSMEMLKEGQAPKAPHRKKYRSQDNLNHSQKYDPSQQRPRPLAVSMNNLHASTSMSFSDLRQREYDNDSRDTYKDRYDNSDNYNNKMQSKRSLAKSVDDVRRTYGGLSAHQSADHVNKTYGGSTNHLADRSYDKYSQNRQKPGYNIAKSVEDVRKVSQNGYNGYDHHNRSGHNDYASDLQVHKNTARSVSDLRPANDPRRSEMNANRGGYDFRKSENDVRRSENDYKRSEYDMRRSENDVRRPEDYRRPERDYRKSENDLRNDRQYSVGSLPSSASSSYTSLDSRSYNGSRQSLDSNGQPNRPPRGGTSYAKPRASKRGKRKAPVPNGMPDIPEQHNGAPYRQNNSSNDAAVLPTSHIDYATPSYRGVDVFNQGSAKV